MTLEDQILFQIYGIKGYSTDEKKDEKEEETQDQ